MSARRRKPTNVSDKPDLFQDNAGMSFFLLNASFRENLMRVVRFIDERGGLPAGSSVYESSRPGIWLAEQRGTYHCLSMEAKACLQALPGFSNRNSAAALSIDSAARVVLFERMQDFAHGRPDRITEAFNGARSAHEDIVAKSGKRLREESAEDRERREITEAAAARYRREILAQRRARVARQRNNNKEK